MNHVRYDYLSNSRIRKPNIFDALAVFIIFSILSLLGWSASSLGTPYKLGDEIILSFSTSALAFYALRTVLRMIFAMILSIIVTFSVGSLMANNARYRQILLPIVDILQSIPPLGVNAFIVLSCIRLFPGSILGLELAAIITTFFSQVWNMILSFYQSLITIPKDLDEVTQIFQLTPWQKFWKLEVPQATPGLILNSMVSMSASWFFVVASESLSIADQKIVLPGVGSFIAQAILEQNIQAIGAACLVMFLVILTYDQLVFRPLMTWSEKFKDEIEEDEVYQTSWFFDLLSNAYFLRQIVENSMESTQALLKRYIFFRKTDSNFRNYFWHGAIQEYITRILEWAALGSFLYLSLRTMVHFYYTFSPSEILETFGLGAITAIKVMIMVFLSACIWVPVGVWIGSNPRLSYRFQPIIQFLAACPPQILYPVFAGLIVDYQLNVEIWTAPIMILGTQWYILFNVIAGTLMITKDQRLVAANFGLRSFLLWRRLYLPAVLPYCVTGCMAAAGGCWNVSIDSDTIVWGEHQIQATGISSYIREALSHGNFDRAILGVMIMTFYVVMINRCVWNPLFEKVSAYHN